MRPLATACIIGGLLGGLIGASALARPREIIVLRHAEKTAGPSLCPVGTLRAQALAAKYLGRGATNSVFGADKPAAFYAITAHSIATLTPAAQSWDLPVLTPATDKTAFSEKVRLENSQTQDAVNDILTNPLYEGGVVVIAWEHKHIANEGLDAGFSDPVTLRNLLHLGSSVPKTWSRTNYDYFWIIDYADRKRPDPTAIRVIKQTFSDPYASVPQNDWDTPEPIGQVPGCVY